MTEYVKFEITEECFDSTVLLIRKFLEDRNISKESLEIFNKKMKSQDDLITATGDAVVNEVLLRTLKRGVEM